MDKAHGDISIHAPAKGATWVQSIALKEEDISIHAPAKGATFPAVEKHLVSGNFNPRSREGSDLIGVIAAYINYTFQSTLPRRERPISVTTSCLLYSTFQSTLPRRERRQYSNAVYFSSRFQSTLPRRERRQSSHTPFLSSHDFNPRSREGSDPLSLSISAAAIISIHAPAKGATFKSFHAVSPFLISIHAPAKGATGGGEA